MNQLSKKSKVRFKPQICIIITDSKEQVKRFTADLFTIALIRMEFLPI